MHSAHKPKAATGRHPSKKFTKPVNFACLAPAAKTVFLVGDFNNWHYGSHPLKRQVDGAWTIQVPLAHGHHQYLFLIDGKPTLDPRAQGTVQNEKHGKVSMIAVS